MMMASRFEIEDQASVASVDNGEILDSASDEADSAFVRIGPLTGDGLIPIEDGNAEYDVINTCFLSGLGPAANDTKIVSVHKNSTTGITTRAKFLAFRVFMEAVARKNGGDANVKYGWYAGSKEEIRGIVSHGFSGREIEKFANNAGSRGVGVHLVPSKFSLAGALATEPDEEGLRHLLLCRIILGKSELVSCGSKQCYPSSIEFDSGVDDLQNPRKYVIWSCSMNSYILPSYIISFRSPRLRGLSRDWSFSKPNAPWLSFPALMSMLSKSIDRLRMNVILKSYNDFRKGNLRRDQLVQKMREVAGDNLLADIIKNYRHKDKDRA